MLSSKPSTKEYAAVYPYTTIKTHPRNVAHYVSKGYFIAESKYYPGRFASGGLLVVKTRDLHPGCMQRVDLWCDICITQYSLRWRDYIKKQSNTCKRCLNEPANCSSHEYWIRRLLLDNPDAICDISGELDKRFLVLHHLQSRKTGGQNEESNYVVLSANHHKAFHGSLGNGGRDGCTPEQYYEYKQKEQEND